MALFPAFINIGGSAELTDIPNVVGAYSQNSVTINANIGDYVVFVAAITGTHSAPVVNGATLIDSNDNSTMSNIRYVYLYKATATTVSATITSSDRWSVFTLS